ncbi:serine/threonine-protein kinase [Longispora albida]|uniref:serine/threonine-protein kinase n=1 Tax=Longispora albida TaxID=203523 RepID=UPI000A045D75|nr:serine/threonine-protein kinase [Longispora albida]
MEPERVVAGRYRLDWLAGSGSMGEVWQATDLTLGRTVAVKLVLAEPARFAAEGKTLAAIEHPNVVRVFGAGPGYLVMEFVEGEPLGALLGREGTLGAARTMDLVAQAADALAAVHAHGVVHRDLSPANLMIRPDGSVVLTDFGIAAAPASEELTATGQLLGTASYVSPEQAGSGEVCPASDLYSLGVIAYECLTGRLPFTAENPIRLALQHVSAPPPPLPRTVPPQVARLVLRLLSKKPIHRYPDATALAQAARSTATVRPLWSYRRLQATLAAIALTAGTITLWPEPGTGTQAGQPAALTPSSAAVAAPGTTTGVTLTPAASPSTTPKATPTPSRSATTATPTPAPARTSPPATVPGTSPATQTPTSAPATTATAIPTPTATQTAAWVAIPQVEGLTLGEAKKQVVAAGFTVSVIGPTTDSNALVNIQCSSYGKTAPAGAMILLSTYAPNDPHNPC